jgi:hypothetical protein
MRNGTAYRLPPLVRLTDEIASGLLPTPEASNTKSDSSEDERAPTTEIFYSPSAVSYGDESGRRDGAGWSGETIASYDGTQGMWLTPHANCSTGAGGRAETGATICKRRLVGSLNPTWVEWLMGFPLGWTDLKG